MKLIERNGAQVLDGQVFDLVVVGAGGAGMACALFAALRGLKVLVVEHTGFVGGTTAWSAGTTWIPGSQHAATVNPQDTLAQAALYLDHAVGERSQRKLRQAFLDNGGAAVAELEAKTDLHFRPYPRHPDYISDLPGSTLCGRALEPLPFDGRLLGDLLRIVRPPIPEFTVLGGMMVDRTDINHLLGMTKSWASLRHSMRILARHAMDRLSHPRGTRLVMGNALVGRLLYSLSRQATVTLALNTALRTILRDDDSPAGSGAVSAASLAEGGQVFNVKVRSGLVLASGGFNRDAALRAQRIPGGHIDWCPGAPGHTGMAQQAARAAGAAEGQGALSHAFWAPVSLRKRADGSTAVFPHFVMDRAKPGMLTVNQAGERFVNESTSYHLFGLAMQEAHRRSPAVPAWLICDARALRAYGIGMVRPGGKGLAPFIADGYLTEASTLEMLAVKLGMEAGRLRATVDRFNRFATTGVDADFHRGETAYQHNIGDATLGGANPNLGELREAPFYAVRLYPGDIGAATGFAGDAHGRVLDVRGQAIAGLYAVGNDLHSIMGGVYPAPGITIGPGLVFARQVAHHASTRVDGPAVAGSPAQAGS